MKMGTIYDLRCRSVLVGERGAVVAREGCGAVCVCVLLCRERKGAGGLMRPPTG